MGRAPLLLAVVLLAAACSVGVEGAPCQTDANCPDGQACEYAGKCSKAAKDCAEICRRDACGAGGPQACVPDANRVCAKLAAALSPCSVGAACGVVGATAECIAAEITLPGANAHVGAGNSVFVTARLSFGPGAFQAPGAIQIRADRVFVGTLPRTGGGLQFAEYSGSYSPGSKDQDVALSVVAPSSPPVESPPLTVNVDTTRPTIGSVSASCTPSPCSRDGILDVSATVTDSHLTEVWVRTSLDGFASHYPIGPIALKDLALQKLEDALAVRVDAKDEQGNTAELPQAVAGGVTRVRPALDTLTANLVSSPAIDSAGTAILGVADTSSQVRAFRSDGSAAWSTTLEASSGAGMSVIAAPSIGAVDVFAASEDGRVYRLLPNGGLPVSFPYYPGVVGLPAATLFSPAVVSPAGVDHAYAAGSSSRLYQFCSDLNLATVVLPESVTSSGVVSGGTLLVVTGTGSAATIRRYSDVAGSPAPMDALPLTDGGAPPVPCDKVAVAPAVDASGAVVVACDNGQLHRVTTNASLVDQLLFQLPARPTGAPIVDRNGDIVLPLADGTLWKLTPGSPTLKAWDPPVMVAATGGEFATGVTAIAPVAAISGPDYYVTTSQGRILALDLMGGVRWSGAVPGPPIALGPPVVAPVPPGGSAYALPTLLAGTPSGKVVRIVVDGVLDTAAPWPKAHHDLRNTGNKASPLP